MLCRTSIYALCRSNNHVILLAYIYIKQYPGIKIVDYTAYIPVAC